VSDQWVIKDGATLRDQFAMQVFAVMAPAILAPYFQQNSYGMFTQPSSFAEEFITKHSYRIADLMLTERDKPKEQP
jgi:hypothetical protein